VIAKEICTVAGSLPSAERGFDCEETRTG
jgi:hypothetical protein